MKTQDSKLDSLSCQTTQTKKRKWISVVWTKMVHGWTISNSRGFTIFVPLVYIAIPCKGYTKMAFFNIFPNKRLETI
jgi:hypothetical protein